MANTKIPVELSSTPSIVDNGNATAITIDSSENIGIGTSSPSSELHVDSNNTDTTITIESDLDGSSLFTSGIDLKRETVSKGSRIESIRDASVGGVGLNFLTTADNAAEVSGTLTSRMVILEDGNVGIGTTNPSSKLNVVGGASNPGISIKSGGNSGVDPFKVTWVNGTEGDMFIVDDAGNVGIGTTSPAQKLHVSGNAYVAAGNYFTDSTSGYFFGGSGSFTNGVYGVGINNMAFNVNGSERMRIDSSGKVGIGTSPSEMLHILGGGSGPEIRLQNSSGSHYIRAYDDNWNFLANASNTAMTIKNSGQVNFGTGIGIGGTGSANTLDDYEEGTWNPSFQSDLTTTYIVRVGTYTKVGNLVTAWFHIDINVNGASSSQQLIIAGLPFAAINTSENYGVVTGLHCNAWSTSTKPDHALISPGANIANLYKTNGQAGIQIPTHADIGGGNMLGVLIYRAA